MKLSLLIGLFLATAFAAIAQTRMPAFRFADVKGKYVNSADISIKKAAVLIYFDPDCEECQQFTALVSKNNSLFLQYKVIMVTNAGLEDLKRFVSTYNLGAKKDLVIGTEGWTRNLQRALRVSSFPWVAIYDRRRIQKQVLSAKAPEQLYKQLEESSIK
jgi:hypothetical protein